jgi:hypothetical protein
MQTTVTIHRETTDPDGHPAERKYVLDVWYTTARAEPDVGIMSDCVDCITRVEHEGTEFELTDGEYDHVIDQIHAKEF